MKTAFGIYPPQCAQTPQNTTCHSLSDGGNRTTKSVSLSDRCLSHEVKWRIRKQKKKSV